MQIPIGLEDRLEGVVDLVTMKASILMDQQVIFPLERFLSFS